MTDELSLARPEELKFSRCLAAGCHECKSSANCWHGQKAGDMNIDVAAGSAFSYYKAVATTKCPVGSVAFWMLAMKEHKGQKLTNGYLTIKQDNKEIESAKHFTENWVYCRPKCTEVYWRSQMHAGINQVTINFHPKDLAKPSLAILELEARRVDAQFEDCLDVTNCLKVLGDGSAAGYAIRNQNPLQLACLMGTIGSSSSVSQKCNEWTGCLSSDQQTKLKVLMRAAGIQPGTGLVENMGANAANRSRETPAGCVDPKLDDAESMQCECYVQWHKECGGDDNDDLEACIKTKMCNEATVCDDWKEEECPDMMMAISDGGKLSSNRSEMTKRTEASGKGVAATDSDFESALTGKCTSETQ